MAFRLKQIMEEKSISNVELAKMLGYTTVAISNMVTGKTFPAIKTLEKISELMGVPTWQFFVDPKEVQGIDEHAHTIVCPKCGEVIQLEINVK